MSLKSRENIPASVEIVDVASQSSFKMHARPSKPWLKYKMQSVLHAIDNNII